jgi:eukaryotic-like serine/threonine-protein kinase
LDDSPERQSKKRLLPTLFGATYEASDNSGPGHLMFLRDGVLMAQDFDAAKLELHGEPAAVADRVGSAYETGHFSSTPSVLVYRGQAPLSDFQLTWFDAQGKMIGKVGDPEGILTPRLSPDGSRVAYERFSTKVFNSDVWLLDLKRNSSTRFAFGPGASRSPVWSPDGSEIVFSQNRDGAYNLYRKPVDGSRAEELLLRSNDDKQPFSWSHDGRFLLYSTSRNLGTQQLWVLPMQGEPKPIAFSHSSFDESDGEFSPDGRWVAYASNESGQYEIYVRAFSGAADAAETGGKWLVSRDGGLFPRWKSDGRELIYISLDRTTIMSVSVDSERTFQPGVPRPLVKIPADRGNSFGVAPTPDLKRFLMPVAVEVKVPQSFTVMLNWASELKPK